MNFLIEMCHGLLRAVAFILLGVCAILGGREVVAHLIDKQPPRFRYMLIGIACGIVANFILDFLVSVE